MSVTNQLFVDHVSNCSTYWLCMIVNSAGELTHWGREKMAAVFQTLSNALSWMKMYEFQLKFPGGPINTFPALIQIMAWGRQGDKPLSETMMVSLWTHIYVTRPQWVKCRTIHEIQIVSYGTSISRQATTCAELEGNSLRIRSACIANGCFSC